MSATSPTPTTTQETAVTTYIARPLSNGTGVNVIDSHGDVVSDPVSGRPFRRAQDVIALLARDGWSVSGVWRRSTAKGSNVEAAVTRDADA